MELLKTCGKWCFCWKAARFNSKNSDHVTLTYWDVSCLVGQTTLIGAAWLILRMHPSKLSAVRVSRGVAPTKGWIIYIRVCFLLFAGFNQLECWIFHTFASRPAIASLALQKVTADCCDWAKAPELLKSDAQVIDDILRYQKLSAVLLLFRDEEDEEDEKEDADEEDDGPCTNYSLQVGW